MPQCGCVQHVSWIKRYISCNWRNIQHVMLVISLEDVMTECLSIFWWYTCLLRHIHFGRTDHITKMTPQINQCIHVDAESVSVSVFSSPFSFLSLLTTVVCLSLSLPCYHSLSILFVVWGHFIYSIADRYQVCVSFPRKLSAAYRGVNCSFFCYCHLYD